LEWRICEKGRRDGELIYYIVCCFVVNINTVEPWKRGVWVEISNSAQYVTLQKCLSYTKSMQCRFGSAKMVSTKHFCTGWWGFSDTLIGPCGLLVELDVLSFAVQVSFVREILLEGHIPNMDGASVKVCWIG
jgi:hypothetical protein